MGDTALDYASLEGQREIVELLLAKGAEVNSRSRDGGTALMSASFNGHAEVAKGCFLPKGPKLMPRIRAARPP